MTGFTGEILDIIDETSDVKTFRVKKPDNLTFTSGQYALISIPKNTEYMGESRPFTFSSSPTSEDHVDFTIKKMGDYTKTIFELEKGDSLTIYGPKGISLNFDETIRQDVVFITGGSGITPFMSAIRYAYRKKLGNKIMLFYSNRTKQDIIFRNELDKINNNSDNIIIINTITHDRPEGWSEEIGRIDEGMLRRYIDKPNNFLWYLCGSPPMVEFMRELLANMNVSYENINFEEWQLPGKHD